MSASAAAAATASPEAAFAFPFFDKSTMTVPVAPPKYAEMGLAAKDFGAAAPPLSADGLPPLMPCAFAQNARENVCVFAREKDVFLFFVSGVALSPLTHVRTL